MSLTDRVRRGTAVIRVPVVRSVYAWRPRAAILLYHRVTDLASDPQLLAVSPKNFAEQLEVINRMGYPTRLGTLDEAFERRVRRKPAIVVTFDDGYADNLHEAKPLLSRYGVPATVFVSSGFVRSQREFLHDELDKIFLLPGRLPEMLHLTIKNEVQHWDLGTGSVYTDDDFALHRRWNVLSPLTPTGRHRVYRGVFDALFPLASDERARCLRELLQWSGANPEARPTHRAMTEAELRQLHHGGLVEIGGHTVNHPLLSSISPAAQRAEIRDGKASLENMLRARIRSFAYPYGGRRHYSEANVASVKEAGFERACANFAGFVFRGADRWQLPRFIVRDWSGPEFRDRLRSWIWQA